MMWILGICLRFVCKASGTNLHSFRGVQLRFLDICHNAGFKTSQVLALINLEGLSGPFLRAHRLLGGPLVERGARCISFG